MEAPSGDSSTSVMYQSPTRRIAPTAGNVSLHAYAFVRANSVVSPQLPIASQTPLVAVSAQLAPSTE
jgi:hypothetical protein